jgi:cytochrome P450
VCADLLAARGARPGTGPDALGYLLAAADAGELDARAVRDELVTLVIAGHETVACALTWTLHLLATHQGVQDRLHAELDAVLGSPARVPTWPDLGRLTWTRAVLEESLRLYPPAWVISRRAVVDDVVAGVDVTAGTLIVISPWVLHRRAAAWPQPRRFDPARFLDPRAGRPAGHYLPFGLGPRLCIGRDAALVQAVAVLACLLPGRRLRAVVPAPAVRAMVTLRPAGGLPLRLEADPGRPCR